MPRASEALARAVYCAAAWLLLPGIFGYFWLRGRREPGYRQRWRERLGHVDGLPRNAIWIHAASVGEVALAERLVRALSAHAPQRSIVVSTFTPTGAERVNSQLADAAVHCYLPLDTRAATRRFMRRLQPHCGIIIETELWPNLLAAAARARVPVAIANANISARSAERYQKPWLAPLMRPGLAGLAAVAAADPVYAHRFEALGARAERIHVTGDLKYDVAFDPQLPSAGAALRHQWQAGQRPVWVAASTHDTEEAIVLAAHRRLRSHGINALLILAPRHPQRFDTVKRLLLEGGWCFAARSVAEPVDERTEIVLGDTLGDVPLFYAASDIAFVGGSLKPGVGGHNMLEAAALARPLVAGPHTQDWRAVVDALSAAGAIRVVGDSQALSDCLQVWTEQPAAAVRAGEAAHACFASERGAISRLLAVLDEALAFEAGQ